MQTATITDAQKLPPLLTAEQVAKLLQVSKSIIYVWVENSIIPFRRLPGTRTIRFERDAVLAWVRSDQDASVTTAPTSEQMVQVRQHALARYYRQPIEEES